MYNIVFRLSINFLLSRLWLGILTYLLSLSILNQWNKFSFSRDETEAQIYTATELVNQCIMGTPLTE